jgi:hypothetical protein
MTRNTKYTIALAKGCGLIEETLTLLSVCDEHTTRESLAQCVHEQNLLSRCSDMRSMDIVKLVFYPRFMKHEPHVMLWLGANPHDSKLPYLKDQRNEVHALSRAIQN